MKNFRFPFLILTALFLLISQTVFSQNSTEKEILEKLLTDFLDGASVNDAAMHDRFWADDLIYTGSAGTRVTKQDILSNLPENPDPESPVRYYAENVQIQLYGETAVVAFQLVGISNESEPENRMNYFNTGTFVKRHGEWRAVAWQATKIPD